MRRFGSATILACASIMGAGGALAQSCVHPVGPTPFGQYGDANASGAATAADVLCIILGVQAAQAGQPPGSPACLAGTWTRADLDCDGAVTVADAITGVHLAIGLGTPAALNPDAGGCPMACGGCATPGSCASSPGRGVWAWRNAGNPFGTDAVVGDPVAEQEMVDALLDWGVSRVYGSYGERGQAEPEVIAAWNARLHAAGIESHVLIGAASWIYDSEWPTLEARIHTRLVAFNAGRADPEERFDGLHLDIEPQAAPDWSAQPPEIKRERLLLLGDTFVFARATLDAAGGAALPIEADLAVWFDNLPPSLGGTGSVGWHSVQERDQWFIDLAHSLDSLSMMAYERSTESSILNSVATETALFPGPVRIGLNEEVGTTWPTIEALFDMADLLEAGGRLVDLHSYAWIRAALEP